MTRSEVDARLAELAARLEADVELSQTREQHMRTAQRLLEVRVLREDLVQPDAPAS